MGVKITGRLEQLRNLHQDPSIGDIYEKRSQVKAGPPYSMEIVTSHRELNNNDHIEVTEGGKAVLDFNGNINITLYNNTQLGGVIAELDPNTSPRIAARLERGGIFGKVITPGTEAGH